MRGRFALRKVSRNEIDLLMNFARSALGVRRVLASLLLLPLRFLQLFSDLVFLVAHVLEMTLQEGQLRCMWIRVVAQGLIFRSAPVRRSRFLCLTDLEKQVVFLFLKLLITPLQHPNVVLLSYSFYPGLIFLLRYLCFLPRDFFLLLSDLFESCNLLRRIIASFLRIVTEAFLNVLGKFGEINFRDASLTG